MGLPKPNNPVLSLLVHPALYVGALLFGGYYLYLGHFFGRFMEINRYATMERDNDPAFLTLALFLVSTLVFADLCVHFGARSEKIALSTIEEVREIRDRMHSLFIKGWFFGLLLYLFVAAPFLWIMQATWNAVLENPDIDPNVFAGMGARHLLIGFVCFVLAIILLVQIPRRLTSLIVDRGWTRGFYRVVVGCTAVGLVVFLLSIIRGHPLILRHLFA